MNKKTFVITLVIGVLSIVGIGGYFISQEFTHIENNQNVKMENKLYIGTYQTSKSSDNVETFNKIYIEIVNNGDIVEKLNYTTNDNLLIEDSNYKNCVFVDLSENMKEYTNNLGIYFWGKSNPNKNYIRVITEYTYLNYQSDVVKVSDCGLYLVNIPTKKGDIPQVEHAYIYQRNIFGWVK